MFFFSVYICQLHCCAHCYWSRALRRFLQKNILLVNILQNQPFWKVFVITVSHKSLLVIIFFTSYTLCCINRGGHDSISLRRYGEHSWTYRKDMKIFANRKVNNTVPINHFLSEFFQWKKLHLIFLKPLLNILNSCSCLSQSPQWNNCKTRFVCVCNWIVLLPCFAPILFWGFNRVPPFYTLCHFQSNIATSQLKSFSQELRKSALYFSFHFIVQRPHPHVFISW